LRILEAIHDFLPDHRAGSEIYTYHLSKALAARGHEVHLVFTEKRLEREQFSFSRGAYDSLPFHEIVYNRHFHDIADLYDDPRMETPVGAILDEVRPDVVHVQSLVYLGLGLIRAAASRGIPLLMTLHEYFLSCPRGGLLLDQTGHLCEPIPFRECARCLAPYPIERTRYPDADPNAGSCGPKDPLRFFERAARERFRRMYEGIAPVRRFIAPSRFLGERLIRDGLPRERVVVSDYGFAAMRSVPRVERAANAPLRIGYLGTLSDYKGVHVLVEAFALLPPGRATLRIKGEPAWFPDYTAPLLERARSIAGLTFEGAIAPEQAAEFLAEIDLLVVPSVWFENSPLTIHEAWQAGVPIVTTALGGMAELAAQGGARTFRRGDAYDLARVLRELIADPSALAALHASIPRVKTIAENAAEFEGWLG
jgi:glycosyltransferase involved in cell wall biosynthesis